MPCIDLADPAVCADPLAAYRRAQEEAPVVTLTAPGREMYAITRHRDARAMLTDPRFAPSPASYAGRPDVPDEYRPYLRTMQEQDGPGHLRLRRAVAPAFTPRRVERYRTRIAELVDGLLADIPTDDGTLDLLNGLARPLPMAVICAVIGVPVADRPRWHGYGALVSAGDGQAFAAAIPAIIDDAKAVLASPEDGVVTDLIRTGALDDTEIVTLIWHLVLAGQVPTPLLAVGLDALLRRPDQLAAVPERAAAAVEELLRWCGPQLLAVPRFLSEDVVVGGVPIAAGSPVTVLLGAANRDPRVFPDPDALDVRRNAEGHLAFLHGAHS
ncbi:MAG TPA: cytochrome P450, partial [Pseudonocardia sp.]|nr:cytochrome P450 [Pseudonocardia sp.]